MTFAELAQATQLPEALLRQAQTMSRQGRPWQEIGDLFGLADHDAVRRLLKRTGRAEAVEARAAHTAQRIASERESIEYRARLRQAEQERLQNKRTNR
ncbi:hypothetical protein [Nocardiopsis sp. NPDC057823]|uniref:hypothetical protein n=1 Tax=Nocardiopsis sp. NPDC057823 TaxID=3346256 RepID=UPI00366BD66A